MRRSPVEGAMTSTRAALVAAAIVAACTDLSSPRPSSPGPPRAAVNSDQPPPGYVVTPGGFLPASGVHEIHPGNALRMKNGDWQEVDSSGSVVTDFGPSASSGSGDVPGFG